MSATSASTSTGIRQAATDAARVGAVVLAASAVANLLALVVGQLAGADMRVTNPAGQTTEVGVVTVLLMTAGPLLLGTAALAVATRWGSRGWTALAWTGLALGLVTVAMPLSVEASADTRLTLASMHVVVGAVWFGFVRRAVARTRDS